MRHTAFILAAALLAGDVHAASCSATADKPVALIELYSSEGCSSCPPADQWLSRLARSGRVPAQVVPLALHVPYWDYIGWRDRFASPIFEQRQKDAARQGRSSAVYTPQVMLNGRDFRGWQGDGLDKTLEKLGRAPTRAVLKLTSDTAGGAQFVSLSGTGPAGARVVLARYENGLSSSVKSGENAGVRLSHDAVVRDWIELGHVGASGALQFSQKLPKNAEVDPRQAGLAAFIEDTKSGEVLQAVMLPACKQD